MNYLDRAVKIAGVHPNLSITEVMDAAKRLVPVVKRCVSPRIRSGRRKSKKRGYSLLELLVILGILLIIGGIVGWKLIHAFHEVSQWLMLAQQTVVR